MELKKTLLIAVGILVVLLAGLLLHTRQAAETAADKTAVTIVIDPGHGGVDGGAQADDGTPEKNINLNIALKLKKLAENDGWNVIMTREEDTGLYSEQNSTIRSKKTEDLKKRKQIFDSSAADAAVSIHLNSYTADRSVRGAQVFYAGGSEESKMLAECVQEQMGNRRRAMAKSDVLILQQVKVPTVIAECGFLSNYEESRKLRTDEYQNEMAKNIYSGIKTYIENNKEIKR